MYAMLLTLNLISITLAFWLKDEGNGLMSRDNLKYLLLLTRFRVLSYFLEY